MKFYVAWLLILLCGLPAVAQTAGKEVPGKIRVGIVGSKPCVFSENGEMKGYSIDVWNAVAKENEMECDIQSMKLEDGLKAVENGELDVVVGNISITEKRENTMDFTMPYGREVGLKILVHKDIQSENILVTILKNLCSIEMLYLLIALIVVEKIYGFILWFFERGIEEIPDTFSHKDPSKRGFEIASWVVWQFMTTIGSGDYSPKTRLGRFLTKPMYLTGAVMLSSIIAIISSAVTIEQIQQNKAKIRGKNDLAGKMVFTKRGSTSAELLEKLKAITVERVEIEEAFDLFTKNENSALVFDSLYVDYMANRYPDRYAVAGNMFAEQYYGFALKSGSKYREPLNKAILRVRENDSYEQIHAKWFGM